MMSPTTCFILNYAPHYRKTIFERLTKEVNCAIYCGNKIRVDIRKIDFDAIDFSIKELQTIWFFNRIAWMKGQIGLLFSKKYSTYVLTGQPFFLSDTIFILLSLFTKKKVLIWNHGPNGKETFLKKMYYKVFFSMLDGAFIYSDWSKKILVQNYTINPNSLHVIYNSLDYENHVAMRSAAVDSDYYQKKKFFKNSSLPILIFIGRLTKIKRIDLVIETVKQLNNQGLHLNLMIIGDGPERNALMEKANDNNSFIHFYGSCYDELENAKLLANADLCVSPGNVGLTGIHAMSFGTPVCTHDDFTNQMPEVGAVKESKTGTFYSLKENNLGQVITNWFTNVKDRKEIRNHCYQKIDTFYNPNYQIKVFKEVLNK